MTKTRIVAKIAAVASVALAYTAAPAVADGTPKPIALIAEPFDVGDVTLLPSPFKTAQALDHGYLLSLDPDRLLCNFRVEAGIPTTAQPYGGWEAPTCGLRGHFVGHYLSACALMYKSTGDTVLRDRGNYIVAEFAKCQRPDGYLSAFPSTAFDTLETKYRGVWAPYYTIHKIMAGLFAMYSECGNTQALAIDEKMATYFEGRMAKLTPTQIDHVLHTVGFGPQNEFGGMSEVLHDLYSVDGDPKTLAFADTFDRAGFMDPLAAGQDHLLNLHANTHIPQVDGIARHYQLTGDTKYRDAAQNFWQIVNDHHSFVTGGNSFDEHFKAPDIEETALSPFTAETCNVYNMLKLTRDIFEWQPDAKYADFYERALYNHILGSIDPDTGLTTYFMPLQTGRFKTYATPQDSFWCCTGTGIENHAKYGDSIYFHNADSLWVNLFIPSQLNWSSQSVTLTQCTQFPATDHTQLTFTAAKPTKLNILIRVPYWATNGVFVSVNGKPVTVTTAPQSYLTLTRTWKTGDTIDVQLPMSLRLYHPTDAPTTAAILYGPLVLAGELGRADMPTDVNVAENKALDNLPVPGAPVLNVGDRPVTDWLKAVPSSPLTFETKGVGTPTDLRVVPYNQIQHQRFVVYWQLGAANSASR